MKNEPNRNVRSETQRMRELVERNLDLGRVDESAGEIAEMLFLVAPKGLQDGLKYNLALEGARHAYTFTTHFEESFKEFVGATTGFDVAEKEQITEISESNF